VDYWCCLVGGGVARLGSFLFGVVVCWWSVLYMYVHSIHMQSVFVDWLVLLFWKIKILLVGLI
jgi:hypothetical protein